MNIKKIDSAEVWNEGAKKLEIAEFLQSYDWGSFQEQTGKTVIRLGFYENNELKGQIQGFEHKMPFGITYLYLPRVQCSEEMISVLKQYAKKQKYAFVRIEPLHAISGKTTKTRQPQHTLVLDLQKDESTLLENMHQKTRYNIRLAEKKGVEIKEGKDVDVFWKLNKETTARDGFKSHGKDYYARMIDLPICHQLTAYYKGVPVASNLYLSFNRSTVYLHGASGSEHRNVMAPYLLQWTAIKFAKKFGMHTFDFWGIAPDSKKENAQTSNGFSWDKNHAWSGITKYKVGFGGSRVDYPNAVEINTHTFTYIIYRLGKLLRR